MANFIEFEENGRVFLLNTSQIAYATSNGGTNLTTSLYLIKDNIFNRASILIMKPYSEVKDEILE